jgi:hypothetical protein
VRYNVPVHLIRRIKAVAANENVNPNQTIGLLLEEGLGGYESNLPGESEDFYKGAAADVPEDEP